MTMCIVSRVIIMIVVKKLARKSFLKKNHGDTNLGSTFDIDMKEKNSRNRGDEAL